MNAEIRLHINVDHVATLRNQRDTPYPDPVLAAEICLKAGAQGITVHLREDRRHIRDADVERLVSSKMGTVNLEMALTPEMAEISRKLRPQVVTLVPEKRSERTTEGGLDVASRADEIRAYRESLSDLGIKLSLFIEADLEQVRASHAVGAAQIELHTGHYAELFLSAKRAQADGQGAELGKRLESEVKECLARFRAASEEASRLGLEVAAGHGLTTENVAPICHLPHMAELNIGHAVIADAILLGMAGAVSAMQSAIQRAKA